MYPFNTRVYAIDILKIYMCIKKFGVELFFFYEYIAFLVLI